MKKITFLLLIFILSMATTSQAAMDRNSLVAEHLIAEGRNYYASGDYSRAVHEFSKALLVDPDNEEAQYYLNELGINVGLLFGRNKTKMYHLSNVAKNIDYYKREMSILEKDNSKKKRLAKLLAEEKEKLNLLLLDKSAENVLLKAQIDDTQEKFLKKADLDRSMIQELELLSTKKDKEIACLNDEVCALEETLITKVDIIEDHEAQIKDLDKDVRLAKRDAKKQEALYRHMIKGIEKESDSKSRQIAKLSTDVMDMKQRLVDKIDTIKEKDHELNTLAGDIKQLERDLGTTEQRWQSSKLDYEREIQEMAVELESHMEKKSEAEDSYQKKIKDLMKVLREKRSELVAKNNKIISQEYKIEIAQRGMAVKNRMINQLRKSLLSLEQHLMEEQARNKKILGKRNPELKELMDEKERERISFIRKQDRLIYKLKQKLAAARTEITRLEDKQSIDEDEIAALKEQLIDLRVQLNKRMASMSREDDYVILYDHLKDAQKQVDVFIEIATEENEKAEVLKEDMDSALTQISN